MKSSRWKINKEREEHLFIFALIPLWLGCLLPYIPVVEPLKGYMNFATTVLGVIACWTLYWVCQRPKAIFQPSQKFMTVWLWINVLASIMLIIVLMGRMVTYLTS